MLNYYINMMEADQSIEMMYGEEGGEFILNAGMFFMKNHEFAFQAYRNATEIALENNGNWARNVWHEQSCIIEVRRRNKLQSPIRVIPHRIGKYNFNTFARRHKHDLPGMEARNDDAFIHYTGLGYGVRQLRMQKLIAKVRLWRDSLLKTDNPQAASVDELPVAPRKQHEQEVNEGGEINYIFD